MKEFIARLSSRKFLLTVAGLTLVTMFPDRSNDIVTILVAFIGAEGVADTVSRYADNKTQQKQLEKETARIETLGEDDAVDKNTFTAGIPDFPM